MGGGAGCKVGVSEAVAPGSFVSEEHFYPKVLNASIHPIVSSFLLMGNKRIVERYCHLNPGVRREDLEALLNYRPSSFLWAGCDLFHVTDMQGRRRMLLIETNSCPSGQKSMPLLDEQTELGGYKKVIDVTFKEKMKDTDKSSGFLAVIYDKNYMEASGYACALAEAYGEVVYLVEFDERDPDPPVRWLDQYMEIRHNGEWLRIRAAFRYVTQRPWNRIPFSTKTTILNPIVVCLAGGRNKAVASKAYEELNVELASKGIKIHLPETLYDVPIKDIPSLVERMGGHAVIKVPYSNAGQGVYTITRKSELDEFMALNFSYDSFVVQSLVGNSLWSSESNEGKFFHTGTVPDQKNHTFVADLRVMVSSTPSGFQPVALYARRAAKPLASDLSTCPYSTWDMLGTNLSEKDKNGNWTTNPGRLLMMDRKDFNQLGIGIDELIDGYIQSVLATIAIDKMCQKLRNSDGSLNFDYFAKINPDPSLLKEIVQ